VCTDPDKAAVLRLGGDISDRRFQMKYEHGIDDGGMKRGDDEGRNPGDEGGGNKDAVVVSDDCHPGVVTDHPNRDDTAFPRRRLVPSADSRTNHRNDEDAGGTAHGGNEF